MPSFMLSILKGKFLNNSVLNKALDNVAQVTHVVTYIEYGSELNIELEYTGNYSKTRSTFFGIYLTHKLSK